MNYLSGRHAMFYLPLFFILVLVLWQKSNKLILNHFISFVLILFLIHYFTSLNFGYYLTWQQDSSTKQAMKIIEELTIDEKQEIELGLSWFFEPSVNYYILKNELKWVNPVDRSGPVGEYEYYYILEEDIAKIEKYNLTLIKEYNSANAYLFAKNNN
jgi:hypothetical protein